jgi:hypothetical protein
MGRPFICCDNYAIVQMGGPGITWFVPTAWRKYLFTPLDTPDRLNLQNIEYELKFLYPAINIIVNYDNLQPELIPTWVPQFGQTQAQVWCDVKFKTVEYNYSTGWYSPVSNAIVVWRKMGIGIHYWCYEMSDENGNVELIALQHGYRTGSYTFWAGKVDEEGNLIYAPNFGENAFKGELVATRTGLISTMYHGVNRHPTDLGFLTLFRCSTLVLFNMFDPRYMNLAPSATGFEGFELSINDFRSHSPLQDFGFTYQIISSLGRSVVIASVPPKTPIEIIFKVVYSRTIPLGFLINASQLFPEGYGYTLDPNEQLVLSFTSLHFTKNMYWIVTNQIETFALQGMSAYNVTFYNNTVRELMEAEESLKNNKYSNFELYIALAWSHILYISRFKIIKFGYNQRSSLLWYSSYTICISI